MHVLIDLAEVSSSGRLCPRTPLGDSCLKIAGSNGKWSRATMFFLNILFQKERCETFVAIVGHVS
jgi:hypothetical protein